MPAAASRSRTRSRSVRPSTGTNGLGISAVNGRIRLPRPAARTIADVSAGRTPARSSSVIRVHPWRLHRHRQVSSAYGTMPQGVQALAPRRTNRGNALCAADAANTGASHRDVKAVRRYPEFLYFVAPQGSPPPDESLVHQNRSDPPPPPARNNGREARREGGVAHQGGHRAPGKRDNMQHVRSERPENR